jgi:hypothetical protein
MPRQPIDDLPEPRLRPSAGILRDFAGSLFSLAFGVWFGIQDDAWKALMAGASSGMLLVIAYTDWRDELHATARRMGWEL